MLLLGFGFFSSKQNFMEKGNPRDCFPVIIQCLFILLQYLGDLSNAGPSF